MNPPLVERMVVFRGFEPSQIGGAGVPNHPGGLGDSPKSSRSLDTSYRFTLLGKTGMPHFKKAPYLVEWDLTKKNLQNYGIRSCLKVKEMEVFCGSEIYICIQGIQYCIHIDIWNMFGTGVHWQSLTIPYVGFPIDKRETHGSSLLYIFSFPSAVILIVYGLFSHGFVAKSYHQSHVF